jgi:hypothetical protein
VGVMRDTGPVKKDADTPDAQDQIGAGRTQLGILKNQMALGGVSLGKRTVVLPDGTTIVASSIAGIDKVTIRQAAELPPGAPPPPAPRVREPRLPEPPPPLGVGALCSMNSYSTLAVSPLIAALIEETVNGTKASGINKYSFTIPSFIGDVPKVIGCDSGLVFESNITQNTSDHVSSGINPTASVQFFDMAGGYGGYDFGNRKLITQLSLEKDPNVQQSMMVPVELKEQTGNESYFIFNFNFNPPFPRWAEPLRIIKWKQTGGDLPMDLFVLPGTPHATVLANTNPDKIVLQSGKDYNYSFGNSNWVVARDDPNPIPGFVTWKNYQTITVVRDWYPKTWTATGFATVVLKDGRNATIAVVVKVTMTPRQGAHVPDGAQNSQGAAVQAATIELGTGQQLPPAIGPFYP